MMPTKNHKTPRITLSMIVKNEEKYLRECLNSVKDVVDEIVIVDTGSTDSTIKIAEEFSAKVFHFKWINDFSAARNYALQNSSGKWILYLDADERLSEKSIPEIKNITQNSNNFGIFCTVKSLGNTLGSPSMMKYTRLFRNVSGLQFAGKVHEQIEDSLIENDCKLIDSEIEIIHLGYDVEQSKIKIKAERNLALLIAEYQANPTGYNAFQLGQTLNILGKVDEANKYFKFAVADLSLECHHRAQAYRQLAAFELKNKQYNQAETYVNRGLELVQESPLLNIVKANIMLETGKENEAVRFCKTAYENNQDFVEGRKDSKFELTINERNIILYGINLSIAAADLGLFEFFYAKIKSISIDKEDYRVIRFYKKILFNENIATEEIERVFKSSSKIDFLVLIKNLLRYKILKSKLEIIESAYKLNANNPPMMKNIYSLLLSERENNPTEYLEKAYELDPQNLEVGFNLMNSYLSKNKIRELLLFIDKAVKSYSAYPNIVEKFNSIRIKIIQSGKKF